jgi:peroxiredoxin
MLMIELCFLNHITAGQNLNKNKIINEIIIEIELPKDSESNDLKIECASLNFVVRADWKPMVPEAKGHFYKWRIFSDEPKLVNLELVMGKGNKLHLYEPGDSIRINLKSGNSVYSGRGAGKFKLLAMLKERERLLPLPENPSFNRTNSLQDYHQWNAYLNKKLEVIDSICQLYKSQISSFAYEYIRTDLISEIEFERVFKFYSLMIKGPLLGVSAKDLGHVFDSTMYGKQAVWLRSYTKKAGNFSYFYFFVRVSVAKKYKFNLDRDIFKTPVRKIIYAELGKQLYKGEVLQGFLTDLLTSNGLKEHTLKDGSTPEIEQLLNEFYAIPGYPEYKAYVNHYERVIRNWVIRVGQTAPDFSLENEKGKLISKKDLKGKLVLLNFFDSSMESIDMTAALGKVQQVFADSQNLVFLNISAERDKTAWKKSLSTGQPRSKNVINLYTNGLGMTHPVFKYYDVRAYSDFNVKAYPKVFLINNKGKLLYNGEVFYPSQTHPPERSDNTFPDPRKDNGQALINDIYGQLAQMNDGPYIFYGKDRIIASSIQSSKVTEQKYPIKSVVKITSGTDDFRKTFSVQLKSKLALEPSVTVSRPERLFVLSDIEGNFDTFRKLLQANQIIDDQFNWVFGKGHLVFAGDMFDRGIQVTECLWLVYVLEEKAKAAGGYVHFVLGNHEIMNLQGDHRYVNDKYKENAKQMGKTLLQLYIENSELGRWLRTKNIVEKIGDLLFAHGGISAEMSKLKISVAEINKLARPNYANRQVDYKDVNTNTIMSSKIGPFWYRGYYGPKSKAAEAAVDSVLRNFNIRHIITGHTIVADTISIHYGGKVINTDTKHRDGKSEALLVEGNNFYRVNAEGKRVLLFRDEEK